MNVLTNKWAYYNEHDPFAAAWLRELIKAKLITEGEVDERSVSDVLPADVKGFRRAHWFAGIAGWEYALRLAGWPDDRPVWTGSCPCQPFSTAGAGGGFADERHLWPDWYHLISQCRPGVIFGEQVEAAIKHGWLDLVQDDMEGIGYAVGAVGLPAASVGAPHIRQRLWFVADSLRPRLERGHPGSVGQEQPPPERGRAAGELADSTSDRCTGGGAGRPVEEGRQPEPGLAGELSKGLEGRSVAGELEYATGEQTGAPGRAREAGRAGTLGGTESERRGEARTFSAGHTERVADASATWSACGWIHCRDGKARPVEPGTFPLAHGVPARVGRLRGYGNAIVPQTAEAFIRSYLDE